MNRVLFLLFALSSHLVDFFRICKLDLRCTDPRILLPIFLNAFTFYRIIPLTPFGQLHFFGKRRATARNAPSQNSRLFDNDDVPLLVVREIDPLLKHVRGLLLRLPLLLVIGRLFDIFLLCKSSLLGQLLFIQPVSALGLSFRQRFDLTI